MSKKVKRIIAIIGLVFMAIFTVAFIVWLVNPKMWDGKLSFVCLVSGGIGLTMFFLAKFTKPFIQNEDKMDEQKDKKSDNDSDKDSDKDISDETANKVDSAADDNAISDNNQTEAKNDVGCKTRRANKKQ